MYVRLYSEVTTSIDRLNLHLIRSTKDPPLNGPLLNHDNRSPLLFLRDLDQIHRDLRRCDTNTDTVNEPTDNQHAYTITARLYRSSQQPPEAGKGDGITTANTVRHWTSHDGTNYGPACECGADTALGGAGRVVEVVDILLRADNGRDGRDVETKAGEFEWWFFCGIESTRMTYSIPPTVAMVAKK